MAAAHYLVAENQYVHFYNQEIIEVYHIRIIGNQWVFSLSFVETFTSWIIRWNEKGEDVLINVSDSLNYGKYIDLSSLIVNNLWDEILLIFSKSGSYCSSRAVNVMLRGCKSWLG